MTIAEALASAGQKLQGQFGDKIPHNELQKAVVALTGCAESSVLPGDYCYNWTNKGVSANSRRLFLRNSRGLYHYVGANYPYTGPVFWKPNSGVEQLVGQWENGRMSELETGSGVGKNS